MSARATSSPSKKVFFSMSKQRSFLKRVVERLIGPSRKAQKRAELVHADGRVRGQTGEPLDFESVESDAAEIEPAEGRYYGQRRVAANFMPAERRYRGRP